MNQKATCPQGPCPKIPGQSAPKDTARDMAGEPPAKRQAPDASAPELQVKPFGSQGKSCPSVLISSYTLQRPEGYVYNKNANKRG